MAIKFQKEIKKQRNLIFVFLILILLMVIIVWRGFFVIEKPPETLVQKYLKKIEIDFATLQNPLLEQLQLMEKIPPFEKEIGRENPFIPSF